jgi:tetratricopeptide (TPR) repeat protein
MNLFDRFCRFASLSAGTLLLCFSLSAIADDIQDANKLFKQGLYSEALAKVEAVLASKPSSTQDAQARFLKGLILTEQGKSDDAIGIFSGLTEDYPDLPEPYNNLAVLYAGQGKYEKAKSALEMAIRTHPGYATAHENLGDIYTKLASSEYERAQQLDPNNTNLQTKLAMIKQLLPKNIVHLPPPAPAMNPASAPAAASPDKP